MKKANIIRMIVEIGVVGILGAIIGYTQNELENMTKERDELLDYTEKSLELVDKYKKMLDKERGIVELHPEDEEIDDDED